MGGSSDGGGGGVAVVEMVGVGAKDCEAEGGKDGRGGASNEGWSEGIVPSISHER